jgi:AcrR family transcriptional regulator
VSTLGDAPIPSPTKQRVGRPRDERAEKAIIDATIALVGEVGFGNLTVDAVAARAGVGKATIYRRWSSKPELLLAALNCIAHEVDAPDTGSLVGDLAGLWGNIADHVRNSEAGRAMPSLVAEAECNPELRAVLHRFVDRRRAVTRGVLERAQQRGEVRDDIDLELVIDMFSGPIFYRRLLSGAPIHRSDGERFVQLLLTGIGEKAQRRRRSPE